MATKKAMRRAEVRKKEVTQRIRRLISEAGQKANSDSAQAAFCRLVWGEDEGKDAVDGNKSKVSKWARGGPIETDEAVTVARAFGYRAAWLLFGEPPEREGISRTDAALCADLAAYLDGEVRRSLQDDASVPTSWKQRVADLRFDGADVLRRTVAREVENIRRMYALFDTRVEQPRRERQLEGMLGKCRSENVDLSEQVAAFKKQLAALQQAPKTKRNSKPNRRTAT